MTVRTVTIAHEGRVVERIEKDGKVSYLPRKARKPTEPQTVFNILWACSKAGVQMLARGQDLFASGQAEAMGELLPGIVDQRAGVVAALTKFEEVEDGSGDGSGGACQHNACRSERGACGTCSTR